MSAILLAGFLFTSVSHGQTCEISKVETPVIFQKPPVDVALGMLSIQMPNCKVLSLGFRKYDNRSFYYQLTDGGGTDETFGRIREFTYGRSLSENYGVRLKSFFAVPDGVMVWGWLGNANEMFFVKFKNDGTIDRSVFNGRGSTSFATISPDGPYTYMSQYSVNPLAVTSNEVTLNLHCEYSSGTYCNRDYPKHLSYKLGWSLPELPKDPKPLAAKCPNISGDYVEAETGALVSVTSDGCRSVTYTYDSTNARVEAEFQFIETLTYDLTGEWVYSKVFGWQRLYVENQMIMREHFNDRFILEKAVTEFHKPKSPIGWQCFRSFNEKKSYVLWRTAEKGCSAIWSKGPK